jgi:hypothetical protein
VNTRRDASRPTVEIALHRIPPERPSPLWAPSAPVASPLEPATTAGSAGSAGVPDTGLRTLEAPNSRVGTPGSLADKRQAREPPQELAACASHPPSIGYSRHHPTGHREGAITTRCAAVKSHSPSTEPVLDLDGSQRSQQATGIQRAGRQWVEVLTSEAIHVAV